MRNKPMIKTIDYRASEFLRPRIMISFIVPAYNEETELPSTLAAIRAAISALSQPFEIIVVDDASTDATPEIAEQAGARVVPIHRRQIAAARNAGARAAQGEYLFFVDADTRINQTHVTEAMALLEAGCTGGGARGCQTAFVVRWQTRRRRRMIDTDASARGFSAWVAKMRSSSTLAPSLWQRATKRRISRSSSCMRKIPAARMCRSHFLRAGSSI